MRERAEYRAYLVRCWQERESADDGERPWRFLVEEIWPERRKRGFSSQDALIAFLRAELAEGKDEPPDESRSK
jgi:hypothetical protein